MPQQGKHQRHSRARVDPHPTPADVQTGLSVEIGMYVQAFHEPGVRLHSRGVSRVGLFLTFRESMSEDACERSNCSVQLLQSSFQARLDNAMYVRSTNVRWKVASPRSQEIRSTEYFDPNHLNKNPNSEGWRTRKHCTGTGK